MKKNKRWTVLIVLVCVIAIVIAGWKIKKIYAADAANVKKIMVAETEDNVKVKVSGDDQIHVIYYESLCYKYNIDEKNSVLTIQGINRIPVTLDLQGTSLILEVPESYGNDIEINTEKNCSIDEEILFQDIKINSENNE